MAWQADLRTVFLRPDLAEKVSGLRQVARYSVAGLWPAGVFIFGYLLYYCVTVPLELITDIRFPEDKNLVLRTTGLLAVAGTVIGSLIGFVQSRNKFGFVSRYLFLFGFGSIVPLLASGLQYRIYLSDSSQFAFDDAALITVGHAYSIAMRESLTQETRKAQEIRDVAMQLSVALKSHRRVRYLDSVSSWEDDRCRRLSLGLPTGAICVERRFVAATGAGGDYSYYPIIRSSKLPRAATEVRVDLPLLTGRFRIPVPNDLIGGGGFNFLRHDSVDGAKLRILLRKTAEALDARHAELSRRKAQFDRTIMMPYWYFLSSAAFAFVGSDFALIQPIGFWPVTLAVALATFRYLYFAVLVAVFLEPIASKPRNMTRE